MNITITLIGRFKELIGTKELTISVDAPATIWDVVDALTVQYPLLDAERTFMIVSRNNVFSTFKTKVTDGDRITLSPPIVGGG